MALVWLVLNLIGSSVLGYMYGRRFGIFAFLIFPFLLFVFTFVETTFGWQVIAITGFSLIGIKVLVSCSTLFRKVFNPKG